MNFMKMFFVLVSVIPCFNFSMDSVQPVDDNKQYRLKISQISDLESEYFFYELISGQEKLLGKASVNTDLPDLIIVDYADEKHTQIVNQAIDYLVLPRLKVK